MRIDQKLGWWIANHLVHLPKGSLEDAIPHIPRYLARRHLINRTVTIIFYVILIGTGVLIGVLLDTRL